MKILAILILCLLTSSCTMAQGIETLSVDLSCPDGQKIIGRIWNRNPKNEGCIVGQDPYVRCVQERDFSNAKFECVKI